MRALRFVTAGLLALKATVGLCEEVYDDNFDEVVLNPEKNTFVKFYASWCSHCQKMAPAWEALASSYPGIDDIQFVEIDGDKNKEHSKYYDIHSFPTLLLFKKDALNDPIKFEGERDVDTLGQFVEDNTGIQQTKAAKISRVVELNDGNFEKYVTKKRKNAILLFTSENDAEKCKECKKSFDMLGNAFYPEVETVIVGSIDKDGDEPVSWVTKLFNIKNYPTVVFVPEGKVDNSVVFEGSCNQYDLLALMNEKLGTKRTTSGGLESEVGMIPEMKESFEEYVRSSLQKRHELVKPLIEKLKTVEDAVYREELKYYARVITVLLGKDGREFVEKEKKRLSKVKEDDAISREYKDRVAMKLNLLNTIEDNLKDYPGDVEVTGGSSNAPVPSDQPAQTAGSSKDEL